MKTIFKQTETAFNAITFQEAIIMVPVVDNLCEQRNRALRQLKESEERKANGEKVWGEEKHWGELLDIEERIHIMLKLGFCPSNPGLLQEFPTIKVDRGE